MRVVMVPGWQAKVRPHLLRFQRKIAGDVLDDVRANIVADGLVDTGAMLASVRQEGTRVYVGTDHWHFLEYGTRAHPIYPNTKQALWWPDLAHPVARVNHPGNREYAFMRRALYKKRG
jgi:hypothetical protein